MLFSHRRARGRSEYSEVGLSMLRGWATMRDCPALISLAGPFTVMLPEWIVGLIELPLVSVLGLLVDFLL